MDRKPWFSMINSSIFVSWKTRASPLPRVSVEQKKKDSSFNTCSKSLFNISSSQSRYGKKGKDEEGKYVEVEQFIGSGTPVGETSGLKEGILKSSILEIESIAKSLGAVDISKKGMEGGSNVKEPSIKRKKWTRRKGVGRRTQTNQRILNAKN
ncbi:unnamed protein product [Vicia faba]|uniref:Uncharacterized protein n=1 Tax=Vicia faba TaxID=3906 RepID=A0AAV1B860_VICFA|nr:unnamed protein product [Vicia faba]